MSSTLARRPLVPPPKTAAGRCKKSVSLPADTVEYLKAWMMSPAHVAHPYPTEQEKADIMAATGIELKQLTNWFVNNRKRFWKPRVEAKLQRYPLPLGRVPAATPGDGARLACRHATPKPRPGTQPSPQPGTPPLRAPSLPAPPTNAAASAPRATAAHVHPCHARPGPGATLAAIAAGARRRDDPHPVSEGSGSSACSSDDDSAAAPSTGGAEREVLRVKKHYLQLYLATRGIHGASGPAGAAAVSSAAASSLAASIASSTVPVATLSARASPSAARTRSFSCAALDRDPDAPGPPPPKRHCSLPAPRVPGLIQGEDEWRRLCQNADSLFSESLPGLEDAGRMFGYVSH